MNKINSLKNKGFTLLEMVISITIFAFLTVLLVAKYGTFNQGILLTNLAYDIALTIRNAQSYGLNVKSLPVSGSNYSDTFDKAYGVYFNKSLQNNTKMIFFADLNDNHIYDSSPDEMISSYTFKRDFIVSGLCSGVTFPSCFNSLNKLSITFKRPNPDAIITQDGLTFYKDAQITVKPSSSLKFIKNIRISSAGQITVLK